MLQRIQTVFLFLVIVLIALSVVLPIAFYSNLIKGSQFNYAILNFLSFGENSKGGFSSLPLFIPAALCVLLSIIEIFAYKKRGFQIKIGIFNILFNVIYLGILMYYFSAIFTASADIKVLYKYPLIFPVIALILNVLAIRGVKKDDELVKSLDRLR